MILLVLLAALGALAPAIAPYSYDAQFRDAPDAPPGPRFRMGTDEIGRDRFIASDLRDPDFDASRARRRARVHRSGARDLRAVEVRALGADHHLPLAAVDFSVHNHARRTAAEYRPGSLGRAHVWPDGRGGMGIARARIHGVHCDMKQSGWLMQARAAGISRCASPEFTPGRTCRSVALAQFRVLVPAYILSEASLGLLGLGVPDPLPSWGNLLRDLQHPDIVRSNPWVLAPLGLLMLVMLCLELLQSQREVSL